ncbi:hypothetical protein [Agrobacterium pusense]|uniref:Uncharacterized protein n=1 Tax=Agrobacterium pusense TaxID=648995 RepID=A0A6H0ZKX2_9HYPH|nr:hypothetical protein [Agrobacterium pusense]QIX20581.1 hypothetical protein FOB41_05225 [Agrobacterium pusense]WCK25332.1 hypothetical protein CFBP5496_0007085 [Agrobacterium pusense]
MTDDLISAAANWDSLKVWFSSTTGILVLAFVPPILLQLLFIYLGPVFARASTKRYKKSLLRRISLLSRCIASVEAGTDRHRLLLATQLISLLALMEATLAVIAVIALHQGKNIIPLLAICQGIVTSALIFGGRLIMRLFDCIVFPRSEIKKLKTKINIKNPKLLTDEERKVLNSYLDRLSRQSRKTSMVKLNIDTHQSVEAFLLSHDQSERLNRMVEQLEKSDLGIEMSRSKISELRSE